MARLEQYPNVTNLSATLLVKNVCDYSGEIREDVTFEKNKCCTKTPAEVSEQIMKEDERWLDSPLENNPEELYVEPKKK